MSSRKKKLCTKKDPNFNEMNYEELEAQKLEIVQGFEDDELDKMLRQSNQSNKLDIVQLLIGNGEEEGLLSAAKKQPRRHEKLQQNILKYGKHPYLEYVNHQDQKDGNYTISQKPFTKVQNY